jgi:hypothetical protein
VLLELAQKVSAAPEAVPCARVVENQDCSHARIAGCRVLFPNNAAAYPAHQIPGGEHVESDDAGHPSSFKL